jgi:hypothetical protein
MILCDINVFRYLPEDSAAAERMTQLRTLYSARMLALGFSLERQQHLLAQMYFANVSATTDTTSFIQGVLNQWVSPSNVITASSDDGGTLTLSPNPTPTLSMSSNPYPYP